VIVDGDVVLDGNVDQYATFVVGDFAGLGDPSRGRPTSRRTSSPANARRHGLVIDNGGVWVHGAVADHAHDNVFVDVFVDDYAAFGATTFGMRTRGPTRNVICLTLR
jgi:hypothetical protein